MLSKSAIILLSVAVLLVAATTVSVYIFAGRSTVENLKLKTGEPGPETASGKPAVTSGGGAVVSDSGTVAGGSTTTSGADSKEAAPSVGTGGASTGTGSTGDAGAGGGDAAGRSRGQEGLTTWSVVLMVALILMALATLVAVGISFYLYRWRRLIRANTHLVVPEQFGSWIDQVGILLSELRTVVTTSVKMEREGSEQTRQEITGLAGSFLTLQNALDERDAEIRRYKNGYDAEIFRKFIMRFVRVDQALDDLMQEHDGWAKELGQVRRLLEDAFDECGVERFHPMVGDDYRTAYGVADHPKKVSTGNPAEDHKVLEVIGIGYRVRGVENHTVIVPSRVRIAIYSE